MNSNKGLPRLCVKCHRCTCGVNGKGECSKCNPNGDKEEVGKDE